jgi:HEAT repeat protein
MHITRRKVIVTLLLAALVAAGVAGLCLWDLKHRSGLPPLVRERMPAYWRTVFIGDADVRNAVRGLYAPDATNRRAACDRLCLMGERAAPAVPHLVATLANGSTWKAPYVVNEAMIPDDQVDLPAVKEPQEPSWGERLLSFIVKPPDPSAGTAGYVASGAADALAEIGPPAEPVLLAALADPLPQVRGQAALALGNIADPAAIDALQSLLADRRPEVRPYAVVALGQFNDPRAVEALTEACTDTGQPEIVRHLAAAFLIENGPAGIPVVLRLLRSTSVKDRRVAAGALAITVNVGNGLLSTEDKWVTPGPPPKDPAVVEALAEAVNDPDETVASYAVCALARHLKPAAPGADVDERIVPALLSAMHSRYVHVQELAETTLGARPDPRAMDRLTAMLRFSLSPPRNPYSVAHLMVCIDPRLAVPQLAEALQSRFPEVRLAAAVALRDVPPECRSFSTPEEMASVTDALAALLEDPETAEPAAETLAAWHDPRCLAVLRRRAADGSREKQAWCCEPLARLGAAGIGLLLELARRPELAEPAAAALAQVSDPAATDALRAAAVDKKFPVRYSALAALANLGDRWAMEPLLQELDEIGDKEAPAVLKALGVLKDRRAADPIIAYLSVRGLYSETPTGKSRGDTEVPLMATAAWALARMGDPRCVNLYLDAASDDIGKWAFSNIGDGSMEDVYLAGAGEAAVTRLTEALKNPDKSVLLEALSALLELTGPRALDAARRLVAAGSLSPWEREALLHNVEDVQGPEVTAFLVEIAATDPSPGIRGEALRQLATRGGPEALAAIRRAADGDECRSVRTQAWRHLTNLTDERRPAGIPRAWAHSPL